MAAFHLEGVAPPHVTPSRLAAGMMPFMASQLPAMPIRCVWPGIAPWLPSQLHR